MLYLRFEYGHGYRLKRFSLNLTTKIMSGNGEMEIEIVRYDCAHGHLHMHRFYRKPQTKERISEEISMETAKKSARQMRENCSMWAKAFMDNYRDEMQ